MKIAIQAADLDGKRIDGTRVYLLNLLKYFGKLSEDDDFLIYHRNQFNPRLIPSRFPNYRIKKIYSPFLWTQSRFALEIWKDDADVLWMPMHNIPLMRRKKMKTVVTIHDLAFKRFPKTFPKNDLRRLNFLTDMAVKKSDGIIAVSEATKRDILKFYPDVSANKIKVIYHGFDAKIFQEKISSEKMEATLDKFSIGREKYILYVGAIQPRKNLKVLLRAFEILKDKMGEKTKLVLAGERAWSWKDTIGDIEKSPFGKDVILTGGVSFEELAILYRSADLFVLPSIYEGFGIPILEAMASGVPVVCAHNSSLPEVGGKAVKYFRTSDAKDLSAKMELILNDENLREKVIANGKNQAKKFSWRKCASETLSYLKTVAGK